MNSQRTPKSRRAGFGLVCCASVFFAEALLSGCAGDARRSEVARPTLSTAAPLATTDAETAATPEEQTAGAVEKSPVPTAQPGPNDGRVISLAEALELASASNLDLALSRARHEIAEARAQASRDAFLPTLDAGGGISRTDGLVQGAFGDFRDIESTGITAGVTLGLRVNIGARVHEAVATRQEVDAALLEALSTEQQLLLKVIELYEDLTLSRIACEIGQELIRSSEEFEHIASVRFEGGIGLGADVARAQANLAAGRQQLAQAERLWRNAGIRLATVLRLDPGVPLIPADTTLEAWQLPPVEEVERYTQGALQRPDVEAARRHASASSGLTRARWWDLVAPELTLEWRLTGVGGSGETAGVETGPAVSGAAGSVGRSLAAWQNAATAVATPGTPLLAPLSAAAGSGGRAYYAYRNGFGSTHQDVSGLEDQQRLGIWLNWSLSFVEVDRLREQRAATRVAQLQVQKLEEAAVAEVRLAQNDIESALRLIVLSTDEISAAESSHRLSLARFTAGTAISFEVLDAQDALAEARLKMARYTAELNVAQARLLAAAGALAATGFSEAPSTQ